jgi:pilus assembly protein CpaC
MKFKILAAGIAVAGLLVQVSIPQHIAFAQPAEQAAVQQIVLDAGSGRLITLPAPAGTVLSANPDVVRVQPASPTSLFLVGVKAGHTTIIATADNGAAVAQYDVTVRGNASPVAPSGGGPVAVPTASTAQMESAIRQAVPGVQGLRLLRGPSGVQVSGTVALPAEADRVNTILRAFVGDDKTAIVNNLNVRAAIQVNVRVRIAEIDRSITRELGFNWQALGNGNTWLVGLRTGLAAAAPISALLPLGSVIPNAPAANSFGGGYHSSKWDVNGVIDALAADQLITVLAEPNLTAQSGETASFLAGGEFPIPVASNGTTSNSSTITIVFKQFGISLAFVPTVIGPDRINLKVRPEVSQLSTNGAISLPIAGGVLQIPALTVRRAETTVELGSGQSFAIAGLLQHNSTQTGNGLPGLSEVPVLGALFKSTAFQRDESELVIIVTPYIVRPTDDPRAFAAPTDQFKPATDLERLLYGRQLAGGSTPSRNVPANTGFIVE